MLFPHENLDILMSKAKQMMHSLCLTVLLLTKLVFLSLVEKSESPILDKPIQSLLEKHGRSELLSFSMISLFSWHFFLNIQFDKYPK